MYLPSTEGLSSSGLGAVLLAFHRPQHVGILILFILFFSLFFVNAYVLIDIIEHTLYNMPIATTCGVIGGVLVNEKEVYREQIIKMVKKIHRNDILIYINKITEDIILEDYNDEKGLQE